MVKKMTKGLYKWVLEQRRDYKNKTLSKDKIKELELLRFIFDEDVAMLRSIFYYEDIPVMFPKNSIKEIQVWARKHRKAYKNGELSKDEIDELNSIGFIFDEDVAEFRSIFYDKTTYDSGINIEDDYNLDLEMIH